MPVSEESMRVLFESITGEEYEGDDIKAALGEARRQWREDNRPLDLDETNYLSRWIINDGDHYDAARSAAMDSMEDLEKYIRSALADAPEQSAAWHTAREMSAADMDRIEWPEIADDLIGD